MITTQHQDRLSVEFSNESAAQQFARAFTQLRQQWLSGLRRFTHRDPLSLLLIAAVVYGIGGDFFTTAVMMHTGVSEEGNAVALAVMNVIGVLPAIALLSLLALTLVIGGLGVAAPSPYGRAYKIAALVILFAKVAVVTSNLVLWVSVHLDSLPI